MSGLLNQTCSTERPTVTKDDFGGDTRTLTAHLAGVRCRRHQTGDTELSTVSDGGRGEVATHRLWVDFGTDILAKDMVTVDGITYEVVGVDPNMAGRGVMMALGLLEVRS